MVYLNKRLISKSQKQELNRINTVIIELNKIKIETD